MAHDETKLQTCNATPGGHVRLGEWGAGAVFVSIENHYTVDHEWLGRHPDRSAADAIRNVRNVLEIRVEDGDDLGAVVASTPVTRKQLRRLALAMLQVAEDPRKWDD